MCVQVEMLSALDAAAVAVDRRARINKFKVKLGTLISRFVWLNFGFCFVLKNIKNYRKLSFFNNALKLQCSKGCNLEKITSLTTFNDSIKKNKNNKVVGFI